MIRISLQTFIAAWILLCTGLSHGDSTATKQAIADRFIAYRGQVVLVDFWASWCGPCRRSFPWMNTMQSKYGQQSFAVVAVNLDQERAAADKFLATYRTNFAVWYDPEGELAKAFDVTTMPSSFILDEHGHIQSAHRGFLTKNVEHYEATMAKLITANETLRGAD